MADELKRPVGPRVPSQLRRFLNRAGLTYVAEEGSKLRGLTGGKGVQWHWFARCSHDSRYLTFYAYSPVFVKPDKRAAAEYLTRASWGLYFGSFEMEFFRGPRLA